MASSPSSSIGPRRQGSFHPRGLEPLLEGEQHLHNEPSSASTSRSHRAVLATWRNALLLAIALCACLLLVGIPIGLAITIYGAGAFAAVVAPLLSIIGATAVTAAWIAFPAVRSAHTGQVTCLSVAYAWHSMAWLLFWWSAYASWPALARCNTFKIAMAGWVCTFLWCFPIGLDWLLLMRGDLRSAGGARRTLSVACHLTWFVAAGLALPIVRAHYSLTPLVNQTVGADDPAAGTDALAALSSMHVCVAESMQPTWWPHVIMAVWLASMCFSVGVYSFGLRATVVETPRVVWERHRMRAVQITAASLIMQPPSASMFWLLLDGRQPPLFLSLWAIFGGVAAQGALNAVAYFWHEPGTLSALLCGVLLRSSSSGGGVCGGACVDVCGAGGAVQQLQHTDSRFVHFRREDVEGSSSAAAARSGDAVVDRVLAEDRIAVPFRLGFLLVPVAIVGAFLALVVALHL